MTTKKIRSTKRFSTLDEFLEDEGTLEAFQAVAIKEVLVWQITEAMKAQGLSRTRPLSLSSEQTPLGLNAPSHAEP